MHFLQCPQGLLAKHFEKLIQCDTRLNILSRRRDLVLDSPYFDTQPSAFWDPDNPKDHDLHQVSGKGSTSSSFQDIGSPQASLSSCMNLNSLPRDVTSPSSGTVRTCSCSLLFHALLHIFREKWNSFYSPWLVPCLVNI